MPYDIHIDQLQEAIAAHAKWGPLAGADRVRFLALALCGEVGELANLIKKDWRADVGSRREAIKEELADVANLCFHAFRSSRLRLAKGNVGEAERG